MVSILQHIFNSLQSLWKTLRSSSISPIMIVTNDTFKWRLFSGTDWIFVFLFSFKLLSDSLVKRESESYRQLIFLFFEDKIRVFCLWLDELQNSFVQLLNCLHTTGFHCGTSVSLFQRALWNYFFLYPVLPIVLFLSPLTFFCLPS